MSRSGRHGAHSAVAIRTAWSGSIGTPAHVRSRQSLPIFAALATLAFVLVSIVDPYSGAYAATTVAPADHGPTQNFAAGSDFSTSFNRDGYSVTKPPPPVIVAAARVARAAPASGTPDPGTAQAIAFDMVMARGWGQGEFDCLVALWNRESHWNVYANNAGSGAYGIPQALPGSKMASAGADWATNPATQITWGLGYISGRYATPCGAWNSSQTRGWY